MNDGCVLGNCEFRHVATIIRPSWLPVLTTGQRYGKNTSEIRRTLVSGLKALLWVSRTIAPFHIDQSMKVTVQQGSSPILVGFPHSGNFLPPNLARQFTAEAKALPDGDVCLPQLFDATSAAGCSTVMANFSRYLIDVDEARSSEVLNPGPHNSPVCPLQTLASELPIYLPGYEPDQFEVGQRAANYWQPFHDDLHEELLRLKHQHGMAILVTVKPMLADCDQPPTEFLIAADNRTGCAPELCAKLQRTLNGNPSSLCSFSEACPVGFLAANYGSVTKRIHALEISVSKNAYRTAHSEEWEDGKAPALQTALRTTMQTCSEWATS